jgi:hypothetical protein
MLLNEALEVSGIVEQYESCIWTDRFTVAGDFEIYLAFTVKAFQAFKKDYYVWSSESDHLMIIEDLEVESDEEDGTYMKVSGRSLESILDRRIVWGERTLSGNLQTAIKSLINTEIIAATDTTRRIPGFIFKDSTDPAVTSISVPAIQYLGENLYKIISDLCVLYGIGWKVTLNDANQMVFQLYAGKNRSHEQVINPRVIFSPDFDNLGSSKYLNSRRPFRSVGLVGGEGEGTTKRFETVFRGSSSASGLARRELYVNSSAKSKDITATEYTNALRTEGSKALLDKATISAFDGEIINSKSFVYGKDYFLGDIVSLEDDYILDANSTARVVEFIRSDDAGGKKYYPTLQSV